MGAGLILGGLSALGGLAAAAPTFLDLQSGALTRRIEDEILSGDVREGYDPTNPNDPNNPAYETNFLQNLLIDEEKLGVKKGKRVAKATAKDPAVAAMLAKFATEGDAQTVNPFESPEEAMARLGPGYKTLVKKSKAEDKKESDAYDWTKPGGGKDQQIRADFNDAFLRNTENIARQDRLALQAENLADRRSSREGELELGRLKLGLEKQQQANEMAMYEQRLAQHSKDKQQATIAGIIGGLANLGAAFAI